MMGNSDNCWIDIIEDLSDDSTRNIKPYFEAKAGELGDATNGKVTAVFKRIAELNAENNPHVATVSALEKKLASTVPGSLAPKRKDASELYDDGRYAFEIRTETYRFRVFWLRLGGVYPVDVYVDEDVCKELRDGYGAFSIECVDGHSFAVRSDDEIEELFKAILRTRKVRYLVKRLVELASEENEG